MLSRQLQPLARRSTQHASLSATDLGAHCDALQDESRLRAEATGQPLRRTPLGACTLTGLRAMLSHATCQAQQQRARSERARREERTAHARARVTRTRKSGVVQADGVRNHGGHTRAATVSPVPAHEARRGQWTRGPLGCTAISEPPSQRQDAGHVATGWQHAGEHTVAGQANSDVHTARQKELRRPTITPRSFFVNSNVVEFTRRLSLVPRSFDLEEGRAGPSFDANVQLAASTARRD